MNLRKLAKGKPCMVRIPGVCCGDPDTTVLAHLQLPGHGKMGGKEVDLAGVWACWRCHDVIDGRAPIPDFLAPAAIVSLKYEALLRTLREVSREIS